MCICVYIYIYGYVIGGNVNMSGDIIDTLLCIIMHNATMVCHHSIHALSD